MKTSTPLCSIALFLLLLLCPHSLPIRAQAQTEDHNVAFIAYWNKGDKYTYQYIQNEYRIEGTDTLRSDHMSELFSLEVIDSTEHSYTLEYRALDTEIDSNDSLQNKIMTGLQKELSQEIPIHIQTDEFGNIQRIVNMKQIQTAVNKVAKKTKKLIVKELTDQAKAEGMELPNKKAMKFLDQMLNLILNAYTSEQGILSSMNYVTKLFDYHGAMLRLDSTYTSSYFLPSPFENSQDSIPVTTYVSCELADTDSLYIQCYCSNEYNTEGIVNSFIDALNGQIGEKDQIPHDPAAPVVHLEDYYNQIIHIGAGWTTELYYRQTQVNQKVQKIKEYTVNMVFPEEDDAAAAD